MLARMDRVACGEWNGAGVAADTLVDTAEGRRPAGTLQAGALLPGADGRLRPLLAVRRTMLTADSFRRFGRPPPVLVTAGALGPQRPDQALLLGPAQRLHFAAQRGSVAATTLVDGGAIRHLATAIDAVELCLADGATVLAAATPLADAAAPTSDAAIAAILHHLAEYAPPPHTGEGTGDDRGGLTGYVDFADRHGVIGWARDPRRPDAVVPIEIVLDGQVIAAAPADKPRPDLVSSALGATPATSGRHGFAIRFARPLAADRAHLLHVGRHGMLPGSPVLLDAAGGDAASFNLALACLAADPAAADFLAGCVRQGKKAVLF